MRTTLTPQELEALIQFAEDDRRSIDLAVVAKLNDLHNSVQRSLIRHLDGARKRNAMLTERLDRIREKKREGLLNGEFAETTIGSVEVAEALLYYLQQSKAYKLNKAKVVQILYEMYASWLASKGERLFDEHPVATSYGPQFWRVYKRIETGTTVTYDKVKALAEKDPGRVKFCENAAKKYYDYGENELNNIFKKTEPYKKASAERNGGKWNTEIADTDIYNWKTQQP